MRADLMSERSERPSLGSESGGITDEGVARFVRASACPRRTPSRRTTGRPTRTRSITWPRPPATTTRCGASPSTRPDPSAGGPIASPNFNGGDTLIGENEVAHLDPATRDLMKGDPIRGAARLLLRVLPRVVEPAATRDARGSAQRPVGVHDKQSEFAKRAVHEWTGEVFCAKDPDLRSARSTG